MSSGCAIKVAIFGHYLPVYRKGILEKLDSLEDINLTAYYTEDFPAGLKLIKPSDVSFKLMNIKTFLFDIPFTGKKLSIQPTMLAKMLARSHDVYIMPNTMSYLDIWVSLILSRILNRRICLWGHGKGSVKGGVADWCRKSFMSMADALIFYSETGLETCYRSGIEREKLFVAYNALDTDESAKIRSSISQREIEKFLRAQGLEGKKLIIFSGRLHKRKRPDLIVDAMAQIISRVPEAHAIIIGDGFMREEVQKRVIECGLEHHISLKGAIFDERTIAHYLMAGKVAVMPSHAGLFIQHAFAYGLPIVVGNNISIHPPEIELVQNGVTGFFFKDGSATSLAEQLLSLLLDEGSRLQMSLNATKIIQEKYNIDNMVYGLAQAIRYAFTNNRIL